MTAGITDIGAFVADVAGSYVGVTSTHHSAFHTRIYYPELGAEAPFVLSKQEQEFMRKFAWPKWNGDYYTYLKEVHLPHSVETGLDCSGLLNIAVAEVFKRLGFQVELPRHVAEFYSWPLTDFLPTDSLKKGDFLFLLANGKRGSRDHVGIYLGNEKVIHSPGVEGSQVKIVSLEEFTSRAGLLPFYVGLVAAKRLLQI